MFFTLKQWRFIVDLLETELMFLYGTYPETSKAYKYKFDSDAVTKMKVAIQNHIQMISGE